MKTRRHFLGSVTKLGLLAGLASGTFFGWVKETIAKGLPFVPKKGAPMNDLIRYDPENVDPSNLDITPLDEFGTMGPTDVEVDKAAWRLKISGLVKTPLEVSLPEIKAAPAVEKKVLLICPGVFANYGDWKGIAIGGLLEKAGVTADAKYVDIQGPEDRYSKKVRYPIEDVRSNKVFLAYEVNGEPLPMKHGSPLRVVAEGYYGYDWVKYVHRMEVVGG